MKLINPSETSESLGFRGSNARVTWTVGTIDSKRVQRFETRLCATEHARSRPLTLTQGVNFESEPRE
jgi:hypothetical protein